MELQSLALIWVGLSLIVALIAWIKNRSVASWFLIALLISPAFSFLILIFMSGVEKYHYTGEASLNNEAYSIYLSKQYKIEKIETIDKFQCLDKTFDNASAALRYAQSIDRGTDLEILEKNDPILLVSSDSALIKNIPSENIISTQNKSNHVTKSKGGSSFFIAVIGVLLIVGLVYFASKFNFSSTNALHSLEQRHDVSKYTINGELAEAFNFNSTNTDIQRDNLLKEIKGRLVIWEVEVYEVTKENNKVYKVQTSGGLKPGVRDVGTFIELNSKDENESKFIEGLKTGDVIRIKGVLTGDSILRSLLIKPAILWYPEDKKSESKEVTPAIVVDNNLTENKFKYLISKKSDVAFDDPSFLSLLNSITSSKDREDIEMAGWEEYEIIQSGRFLIGQGMLPRSVGRGLCGGGIFILDTVNNSLNIHLCNQAEISSYGRDTSVDFIKENYPAEAKAWLCETYDNKFRLKLNCS